MLAEMFARLPFHFAADDLPKKGMTRIDPLAPPFDKVPVEAAPKTSDKNWLAKDGVTRRLILTYENHPTMHANLAESINGLQPAHGYSGTFQLLDLVQMMIRFHKRGAYPTMKFIDILEGKADLSTLKGKIVLIGRDTLESRDDYATTPLSKALMGFTTMEMHANIIDTLIHNNAPRSSPPWVKWLFTFADFVAHHLHRSQRTSGAGPADVSGFGAHLFRRGASLIYRRSLGDPRGAPARRRLYLLLLRDSVPPDY